MKSFKPEVASNHVTQRLILNRTLVHCRLPSKLPIILLGSKIFLGQIVMAFENPELKIQEYFSFALFLLKLHLISYVL